MKEEKAYLDSNSLSEDLTSIFPRRCQGYLKVLLFFIQKYLEDPSQIFSAYTVEKEVLGISRARPILERLVRKGFLLVFDYNGILYYGLNTENHAVKKLLNFFKEL